MVDISNFIKDDYNFKPGEVVAVDGNLAKGYAEVTEVSWDEPLRPVSGDENNNFEERPFPPHIRVMMIGATTSGAKAGKENRKFLYHGEDLVEGKLRKLTDIDFV